MTETRTTSVVGAVGETTIFVRLFTALRIFAGLVWLSNGLVKVIGKSGFDLGFFSFNLVGRSAAKSILTNAAQVTGIRPLGAFYEQVVLPYWGVWSVFQILAEVSIGVGLLLGIASRLAAVGGLLLIGPVWVMLWHTNHYLWEYPDDLFPLVLLAIAPAGRYRGFDTKLAARFGNRWPF